MGSTGKVGGRGGVRRLVQEHKLSKMSMGHGVCRSFSVEVPHSIYILSR